MLQLCFRAKSLESDNNMKNLMFYSIQLGNPVEHVTVVTTWPADLTTCWVDHMTLQHDMITRRLEVESKGSSGPCCHDSLRFNMFNLSTNWCYVEAWIMSSWPTATISVMLRIDMPIWSSAAATSGGQIFYTKHSRHQYRIPQIIKKN